MANRTNTQPLSRYFLYQDLALIALSILIALVLVKTPALAVLLSSSRNFDFLGTLIAGMFFTSIFTTAPAIVTLGELSLANGIWMTAFWGAAGAVLGDLLIFRFVRDRFGEHVKLMLAERGSAKRLHALFAKRGFRYLTFLAAGFIIASPLPDELGISLLGLSKVKQSLFVPLSFVFNFLGILAIGSAAATLMLL
ncbi:MAG TPA: hypothetical protein VHO23_02250 [Candidatus Paceibacterota bacterium]|nr:hypothetical protein [Candidatus Paceibacterota bacterium]